MCLLATAERTEGTGGGANVSDEKVTQGQKETHEQDQLYLNTHTEYERLLCHGPPLGPCEILGNQLLLPPSVSIPPSH